MKIELIKSGDDPHCWEQRWWLVKVGGRVVWKGSNQAEARRCFKAVSDALAVDSPNLGISFPDANDDKIMWETAKYSTWMSSRLADFRGHRLYVKRTKPRARHFSGAIDGVYQVTGDTIDQACSNLAKIARAKFKK